MNRFEEEWNKLVEQEKDNVQKERIQNMRKVVSNIERERDYYRNKYKGSLCEWWDEFCSEPLFPSF